MTGKVRGMYIDSYMQPIEKDNIIIFGSLLQMKINQD